MLADLVSGHTPVRLASQDPKSDGRAPWVQSVAEFHQDWTEKENQGNALRWRPGVSLHTPPESHRRYKVQVAPRRPRRGLLGWVFGALALAATWWVIRGTMTDLPRWEDVSQFIGRLVEPFGGLL